MTTDQNPYAPPRAELQMEAPPDAAGVWRQGEMLVVSRNVKLPLICIATDHPAQGFDVRALDGLDPPFPVPLSDDYLLYVRIQAWIAFLLCIVGAILLILPFGLAIVRLIPGGIRLVGKFGEWDSIFFGCGLLVLVTGLAWGRAVGMLLYVHIHTPSHIWIIGADPNYLARWPPWPYEPR